MSPLETGHPIKVQITNMLSLMEQCRPSFAEVMIISPQLSFPCVHKSPLLMLLPEGLSQPHAHL